MSINSYYPYLLIKVPNHRVISMTFIYYVNACQMNICSGLYVYAYGYV